MSKLVKSVAQQKRPQNYTNTSRGIAGGVGAVDEDTFIAAFEQVSKLHVYSGKDVTEHLNRIKEIMSSHVEDWEKRVESLKQLRAVVLAGGADYDEFWPGLRALEIPFRSCITDLRSLVVREACITLSYMASVLTSKLDRFAETMLEAQLSLIANSAKVISTSGIMSTKFTLRHTHSARLLPILLNSSQSKSAIQRRYLFECIGQALADWPTHCLEKQLGGLQEALKRGLADADQEARAHTRRAFWHFAIHFRDQADSLLRQLEPKVKQALERERPGTVPPSAASAGTTASSAGISSNRKALPRSTSDHYSLANRPAASAASSRQRHPTATTAAAAAASATPIGQARGRAPSKVSQSTPASREASPGARYGAGTAAASTYLAAAGLTTTGRQSRGPRSQGASREASPGRSAIPVPTGGSGLRRPSTGSLSGASASGRSSFRSRIGSGQHQQLLLSNEHAAQTALAEALQYKLARRRMDHDSGDDNSDTSSMCSDSSFKSFTSCFTGRRFVARISKNMADIIAQLESREWSNRRDGLVSFTNYLGREECQLNQLEMKKICEIFTRLFGESNGRVTQFFLEALVEYVSRYHPQLHDWLYILLVKLVTRLANETLTSQQARVQAALDRVHQCFPLQLQFNNLLRCLIDQNQQPAPKVQIALLQYLLQLVAELPTEAFQATSEVKIAMSRLTMLTREPKSADVRKYSQQLLIALRDLNPNSYATVLQAMSASIQQRANEVVRNHAGRAERRPSLQNNSVNSSANSTTGSGTTGSAGLSNRNGTQQQAQQSTMSPEDVNSYIRQTTQNIQSLTLSGADSYSSGGGGGGVGSAASSAEPPRFNGDRPKVLGLSRTTATNPPVAAINAGTAQQQQKLIPYALNDKHSINHVHRFNGAEDAAGQNPEDALIDILKELSNHNQRKHLGLATAPSIVNDKDGDADNNGISWHEQRKQCMNRLVRMVRNSAMDNWDEHFKTVLLILLETLGDNESDIRCSALSVLQELVKAQSLRFADYIELTVLKVLEAHSDADKSVCKAAEDCSRIVTSSLPADACLRVLIPIVQDANSVINLAAIRMQMRVVQEADCEVVEHFLTEMCPGLVRCCEHKESQIRKAAIFCLVQIFMKVGETLLLHLTDMSNTKKRLLQLYICRAKAPQQSGGAAAAGDL